MPKSSHMSYDIDIFDSQWRNWLPSSVSHTVRRGAFYSVLVRPGFRVISLVSIGICQAYCNMS